MDETATRQNGAKTDPVFRDLDIYENALAAEDSPIRSR